MARRSAFSIYQPEIRIPTVAVPTVVRETGFGADLSQDVNKVLTVLDGKLTYAAQRWTARSLAALRDEQEQALAAAEGDEALAATFQADFDKRVEEYRKVMPGYAQSAFENGVQAMREEFSSRVEAVEAEAVHKATLKDAAATFERMGAAAAREGADLHHLYEEAQAMARSLGKWLPDDNDAIRKHLDDVVISGIAAKAARDPHAALNFLDQRATARALAPDKRETLRSYAKAEGARAKGAGAARNGLDHVLATIDTEAILDDVRQGRKSYFLLPDIETIEGRVGRQAARAFRDGFEALKTYTAREARDIGDVASRMTRGLQIDPKDPAQRRGVNAIWDKHAAPHLETLAPELRERFIADFVGRTWIWPKSLTRDLHRDLKSGATERIARAARTVGMVRRRKAGIEPPLDPDDRELIESVHALAEAGFEDEAAVKWLTDEGGDKRSGRAPAFDRHLTGREFSAIVRSILELSDDAEIVVDDTRGRARTLEYREDRDGPVKARTLEYVPERDGEAGAIPLGYTDPFGGSAVSMQPGGSGPARAVDEPLAYDADDLKKIADYRDKIFAVASKLGINPAAVAGAIAEELDDARRRGDLEYGLWAAKWARLKVMSHNDIAQAYDRFEADLAKDPRLGYQVPKGWWALGKQKFNYPTLLDIGMGKIRLHTAIRMLREYNRDHPNSDPLDLKKYNNAYDRLASDLEAPEQDATAVFAGLVVAEATRWFETKAPDVWAKLDPAEQAALITDYYNLGREAIVHRYQEDMRRDGRYTPGFGDSGKSHKANAQRVWRALYP